MAGSALLIAAQQLRARLADGEAAPLEAHARFESDLVFGSGAYAAVVEIERATGALRVRRVAAVDDAGRIVNPLLAEGQVIGGTVHGLGTSLTEEMVHDEYGQPTTASFLDYGLLTAAEVPEIRTAFVQSPSPRNPLGAKGIGEGGAIGAPGGGRQRDRRRARRPPRRSAVHRRQAVERAAVKPAPFDYAAPESLDDALALLDDDSRPLAGGQSLVPMLNFRLARPARLVDLERVAGLAYLDDTAGPLRIGAMTRQATLERSPLVAARWPLLRQAVRLVGHAQIRSRGTVGGSVAHADPKAELPVALAALDARFHVRSPTGARTLGAGELFQGPLTTALEPDELLVEIEVPPLPGGSVTAFVERSRTHGDFAIAGVAVVVAAGRAAIALLGAAPVPVRATAAEEALAAGAAAADAAALAAADVTDPYRRALLTALTRRAIESAGP